MLALKMMKYCLVGGAAMTFIAATVPAVAYTGQELAKQAKVSITEARAIALKAHPGKITDEELETESGGSATSNPAAQSPATRAARTRAVRRSDWRTDAATAKRRARYVPSKLLC